MMQTNPQSLELQAYIKSISAPRELICPITQDLYNDPVLALGDGYTYERLAITTWFQSQMSNFSSSSVTSSSGVSLRSPVTNAYMEASIPLNNSHGQLEGSLESVACTTLVENKVIASMTHAFREKLGRELCRRCQRISIHSNTLLETTSRRDLEEGGPFVESDVIIGDEHEQIKALVDAGADLSIQECEHGSTAFMLVIRCGFLDLSWYMLRNRPKLSITNDQGYTCLDIAKNVVESLESSTRRHFSFSRMLSSHTISTATATATAGNIDATSRDAETLLQGYRKLIQDLETKMLKEKNDMDSIFKAKAEANAQLRQRQQVLAAGARSYNATVTQRDARINMELIQRGLGQLNDHGWGYFPSLAAMQFHGFIPEAPPSFVENEKLMQRRLERILKVIASIILIFFILM